MSETSLRRRGYNEYKKHRLSSWFLSLFLIAIIVIVLVLGFLFPGVLLFITPLLILPAVFASQLTHLGFSYDNDLTLSGFFKFFKLYFTRPNNGSFRYWVSILKFLIATLVLEVVFTMVAALICASVDQDSFKQMLTIYYEATMENVVIIDPKEMFGETYGMYVMFNNIVAVPTALISGLFLFYLLLLNSLSIFLRIKIKQANNPFIDMVFKHAIKKDGAYIRNSFINLEWPIFVLFALGAIIGSTLTLLFSYEMNFMVLNGLICGAVLVFFFLPLHFANMEVLFKNYELDFFKSVNDVSSSLFKRLGTPPIQNEEEKDEDKKT